MNIIIFLGFYFLTYFIGRGFLLLLNRNKLAEPFDSKQIYGIGYDVFYSIIALFFIGNLLFLINFFIPLDESFPLLILVCLILIIANVRSRIKFVTLKYWILKHLFLPIVISISSYGSWLHFDSGAYHLNYQYWLKTSKITFGLANLNFGYGFSSILEYLQSILWIEDNFIFIFNINLLFYVFLFSFLCNAIFLSENFLKISSVFLLIYGLLDNFGYQGGANGFFQIQAIAKPDMPFGIIFIIISQLLIQKILNEDFQAKDLKLFGYSILFLVQIKLLGLYIGLLVIYYLFKFYEKKKLSLANIFNETKFVIFLSSLWLLKNFFLSGCLLFPLKLSCIRNVSWYVDGYISNYVNDTMVSQRAYFLGENISDWFSLYINKGFNLQILVNFISSIFIILVIRKLVFRKNNKNRISVFIMINFIFVLTWITSSPAPRWGSHIFPFLIISLAINHDFKNEPKFYIFYQNFLLMIFVFTVGLLPRFYSYTSLLETRFEIYKVDLPSIEYINNSSNTGYIVDFSTYQPQQCWVNKMCTLSDKKIIGGRIGIYDIYYADGSKQW